MLQRALFATEAITVELKGLLDILADRFGQIPVELVAQILLADDLLALRSAILGANKIASLAEFRLTEG